MTANTIINRNSSATPKKMNHPSANDTAAAQKPSPASRVVVQLGSKWRVVEAPPHWPLQWILQRKVRGPSGNKDGWECRAFCTTRKALARNIREFCGEVDLDLLSMIAALPETMTRTEFRASRADRPIGTIVLAGCTRERIGAHNQPRKH